MTFDVKIDDRASAKLAGVDGALRGRLLDIAQVLAKALVANARAKASGDLLKVRTGRYVASIHGSARKTDTGVSASVTSSSPLATIFERGAVVPAHDILPNVAQALRFLDDAGAVYAKVVHDPGAVITPKPAIHRAFDDMRGDIVDGLSAAARHLG
jgi:hypothetical protein